MKRTHKYFAGVCGFALVTAALIFAHAAGPDPRHTGAPGDDPLACATSGCHTGPINGGGGSVTIDFPSGLMTYTPGQQQMLSVTVSDPKGKFYGFQMTARLASKPATGQAGDFTAGPLELVLCDDGSSKGSLGCRANASVQFIEHSTPGTTGKWTVKWTPPASDVGDVFLYVAASSNTQMQVLGGDHIYTTHYTLSSPSSSSRPPPFGHIDTPLNGANGQAGAINFTGWALSSITVAQVALCREPVAGEGNVTDPHCLLNSSFTGLVYLGNAVLVAGVRPDVAAGFSGYPNNNWGWGAQILTNELPGTSGLPLGNGTYKLHAIAADPLLSATDLGATTITVNNAASPLPFGTIDTPGQGQTISGTDFVNFGWVVTPQPNIVPIDGSTIMVHIDGQAVGHPTYNQLRSDIATLFPGLRNTNGAVGLFHIDSTKLSNGIHNIDWVATDSGGHSGGIGSRNFFVQN